MEIWKEIPNTEGKYMASSIGRIRSLVRKDKIIDGTIGSQGYRRHTIYYNRKRKTLETHKIIAITFLNHIPCGSLKQVDHINSNKLDNRVENLRIVDARFNRFKDMDKSKKTSKYIGVTKTKNGRWGATISIDSIQNWLGTFDTQEEAHQAYLNAL